MQEPGFLSLEQEYYQLLNAMELQPESLLLLELPPELYCCSKAYHRKDRSFVFGLVLPTLELLQGEAALG